MITFINSLDSVFQASSQLPLLFKMFLHFSVFFIFILSRISISAHLIVSSSYTSSNKDLYGVL